MAVEHLLQADVTLFVGEGPFGLLLALGLDIRAVAAFVLVSRLLLRAHLGVIPLRGRGTPAGLIGTAAGREDEAGTE